MGRKRRSRKRAGREWLVLHTLLEFMLELREVAAEPDLERLEPEAVRFG